MLLDRKTYQELLNFLMKADTKQQEKKASTMTLDQPQQSLLSLQVMRGDPSESRLKMEFDARYSN